MSPTTSRSSALAGMLAMLAAVGGVYLSVAWNDESLHVVVNSAGLALGLVIGLGLGRWTGFALVLTLALMGSVMSKAWSPPYDTEAAVVNGDVYRSFTWYRDWWWQGRPNYFPASIEFEQDCLAMTREGIELKAHFEVTLQLTSDDDELVRLAGSGFTGEAIKTTKRMLCDSFADALGEVPLADVWKGRIRTQIETALVSQPAPAGYEWSHPVIADMQLCFDD